MPLRGVSILRLHPNTCWRYQTVATRGWKPSDYDVDRRKYDRKEVPKSYRSLPLLPKTPNIPPKERMRKSYLARGACTGEKAELQLKQFGVIALKGGLLKFNHLHSIQSSVNKFIKNKDLQAIWRVDAPYRAVTKHPLQAVMGGGKGKIDYYVTPVKARQVIFELGGRAEFSFVYPLLQHLALRMPFPAMAVEYEMLKSMYEEEQRIEDDNENFFTFRELVTKNMQGIKAYVTKNDFKYFGKMR